MPVKRIEQEHLEQAIRHLAQAQQLVWEQRRRVDHLIRKGLDSTVAANLLAAMESTLAQMQQHRRVIEATLAEELDPR